VQREGSPIEEIRPGDVVWIPPNEKHWHGAASTTAIDPYRHSGSLDGEVVDLDGEVSDEEISKRK